MPKERTRHYKLVGLATVLVYSQAEMAEALKLTETRLIGELGRGIGLSYHAHPDATGNGYEFNEESYQDNIKVWDCYTDGGHDMTPKLGAGVRSDVCRICGHTRY